MANRNILDSREKIAQIDKENILGSVEALPEQCLDAWKEANKIDIPDNYKDIKNITMTGMGGSGLGARIIESLYAPSFEIPFYRINDYDLPNYVNNNSFVLCSSYSGTTEETLENARQAKSKNTKWVAMGTGNTLENLAKQAGVPFYKVIPKFNPSNQPRMTVGYQVVAQLVIISKLGIFDLNKEEIEEAVLAMKAVQKQCNAENNDNNPAKMLAQKLKGKILFYISARHMGGAAHAVNNQLNENAKNISFDYQIPELNHHLMEGLKHPDVNSDNLYCIMIKSNLYPKRIQQRFDITEDVLQKNKIGLYVFNPVSKSKLSQTFEFIQFGAYVNLYLAVLYNQNPAPIPWVDYFKNQLGQPLGK